MYQFTEDCLTGIPLIDEEHRRLFEIINEAMSLLHNEMVRDKYHQVNALLEELENYADTHFEHEEAYMEQIQDPELSRQKKQHNDFREKIGTLNLANIDEEAAQEETLKELMLYLTRWLYHHILGSDIMIGKIKERKKEEEDPFAFTKKYYTGIELVDTEHKTLFDIIRSADEVVRAELLHDKYDEIVGILERLKNYTEEHFRDEEEYMEQIGYSKLDAQKRAHSAFVDKLYEIDLDAVDEDQQGYLEELIDYLLSWLTNHILMADKLIGEEAAEKHLISGKTSD